MHNAGTDTVVIPNGYNVNFIAMGFHAFKSVAYQVGDQVLETKAASSLPAFMLYPTRNTQLYLGDTVVDQCVARGMIDDEDRCICASECPAKDLTALKEATKIRLAAKMHARSELKSLAKGSALPVEYLYVGAFEASTVPVESCTVDAGTFRASLKDMYNGQLIAKDTEIKIDMDKLTISITASLTGTGGILDDQKASFSDPIRIAADTAGGIGAAGGIDVSGRADAALAFMLYHGVLEGMNKLCAVGKNSKQALLKAAGVVYMVEATTVVYGGNNLPQIDVNRFVDANNKDGVVTAVYDAIKDMQGWTNLNRDVMYEKWRLAPAAEVHKKGRRAAPARMGLATNLVHVELEYNRWSAEGGPNEAAVERVINWVLATYDIQTHHKCFTFQAGFDDVCVEEIVSTIIAKELKACTDVDKDSVASCRKAAVKAAKQKIIAIKGCGLLGTVASPQKGETVCANLDAASKAKVAANMTAVDAVDAAIAKISATRRDFLAQQLQAALALNATKLAQANKRKEKTEKLIGAATVVAFKVPNAGVEAALKGAKEKTLNAKSALDKALDALNACEKTWPSRIPYHANCTDLANTFYRAEQNHAVAKAEQDVLQTRLDNSKLSTAEKADKINKLESELGTLKAEAIAKRGRVDKIEKNIRDNACDRSVKYGKQATCAQLFVELDAAYSELTDLLARLERLENDVKTEKTIAAKDEADAEDGGGSLVPVIIAVRHLVCPFRPHTHTCLCHAPPPSRNGIVCVGYTTLQYSTCSNSPDVFLPMHVCVPGFEMCQRLHFYGRQCKNQPRPKH